MKKILIAVFVVLLMAFIGGIVTFGELGPFDLHPLRNGASDYSSKLKKDDTYTAVANITPQHYTSYFGEVYMRVRTDTGVAAGNVVEVSTNGYQYLPYWSGYDTVGSYRRLYCNYVSDDTYYGGLIIEGRWEP